MDQSLLYIFISFIEGYYDFVPETVAGKMVGGVCTIVGLFCISFPVPVIVSHFAFLYNRDKAGREAQALQLLNREFGEINTISENVPQRTIRHQGVSKSFRTDQCLKSPGPEKF